MSSQEEVNLAALSAVQRLREQFRAAQSGSSLGATAPAALPAKRGPGTDAGPSPTSGWLPSIDVPPAVTEPAAVGGVAPLLRPKASAIPRLPGTAPRPASGAPRKSTWGTATPLSGRSASAAVPQAQDAQARSSARPQSARISDISRLTARPAARSTFSKADRFPRPGAGAAAANARNSAAAVPATHSGAAPSAAAAESERMEARRAATVLLDVADALNRALPQRTTFGTARRFDENTWQTRGSASPSPPRHKVNCAALLHKLLLVSICKRKASDLALCPEYAWMQGLLLLWRLLPCISSASLRYSAQGDLLSITTVAATK